MQALRFLNKFIDMEKKVQFLICGAQKGGTTALTQYLNQHPNIFIPEIKEVHFFDNESRKWDNKDYTDYHQNFKEGKSNQIWGEATPIYMYWDKSPERIWQYNSNIKIIIILRNPITRSYSHWAMESNRGQDSLSFEKAIELEDSRKREDLPFQHRVYSYVDRGYYCNQINRLWHYFGKDSVLILKQEDLRLKTKECLSKITNLLNIQAFKTIDYVESHIGHYSEKMDPNTKIYLKKIFYYEIKQLEVMLNWNCKDWLEEE